MQDEEGSWIFSSSGMDSQLQQLKRFDTVSVCKWQCVLRSERRVEVGLVLVNYNSFLHFSLKSHVLL